MSRFLFDAQLPRKIAIAFGEWGYDALHTLDLPEGNRTPDAEINRISSEQLRIVVTKDKDFLESFLLTNLPYKLLRISTGNITNAELVAIFARSHRQIVTLFEHTHHVELTRSLLIAHQ